MHRLDAAGLCGTRDHGSLDRGGNGAYGPVGADEAWDGAAGGAADIGQKGILSTEEEAKRAFLFLKGMLKRGYAASSYFEIADKDKSGFNEVQV